MDILFPNQIQSSHIELQTSKHRDIPNRQLFEISSLDQKTYHKIMNSYPSVIFRNEPNPIYNCHGLTFASSRTGIEDDEIIPLILDDDDYREILNENVLPGDIIIYKHNGGVIHSGIVVSGPIGLGIPMVLSKWGSFSEIVHLAHVCPYDSSDLHYYRKK